MSLLPPFLFTFTILLISSSISQGSPGEVEGREDSFSQRHGMIKPDREKILAIRKLIHAKERRLPLKKQQLSSVILSVDETLPEGSGDEIWPMWKCPIPYVIKPSITNPQTIVEAMDYISTVTKWSFAPRNGEGSYLKFFDGDGCWSYLGLVLLSLSLSGCVEFLWSLD